MRCRISRQCVKRSRHLLQACTCVPTNKFIAVAGNIGAGKTELTRFLCQKYQLLPFFEPNDQNPYLADFYDDMKTWAYRSQLFFLTHKFRLHRELEKATDNILQDRTIYEDAEIFAQNLKNQRHIDKRDFKTYWTLYETIASVLRPPDLMIYLRCPVKTLQQRIKKRGRAMEQRIPTTYLTRLNRLYEDWFNRYSLSKVVVLETEKLDYLTNLVDRAELFEKIEAHL
jgi:deoxyadenosine/deoxycytidine kinase